MHIIGYVASILSKRFIAINLDKKIIISIIKKFNIKIMGATENKTFLPLLLPLATIVLIAMGSPSCVSAITKEYVGITRLYRFIPSLPIILVKTILIINPNALVRTDPINKIKALLKNKLFFIFNYIH